MPAWYGGEDLKALLPGARSPFRCALHVPTDGCAEPQRAAPAIARAAQRKGALIVAHCAVRGIDRGAGRISAVVTERGRIACDTVILGRRSLEQPILCKPRDPTAATQGAVVRDAHGARTGWS